MNLINGMINEIRQEGANTRGVLERIPDELFSFRPHERSFALGRLATHIAELGGWVPMIVHTEELDFAAGTYKGMTASGAGELLKIHDENIAKAIAALESITPEALERNWTLRRGDHIIMEMPKLVFIRSMALNHLVHHRGQLTVYLRLNDIPLPGIYGPSADDQILAAANAAATAN